MNTSKTYHLGKGDTQNYDILQFIENFKSRFPEHKDIIEHIFLNGACYHFAVILSNLFEGSIFYDPIDGHFIFKHKDKFYDIKGVVERAHWDRLIDFNRMPRHDHLHYQRIIRDCVYMEGT